MLGLPMVRGWKTELVATIFFCDNAEIDSDVDLNLFEAGV